MGGIIVYMAMITNVFKQEGQSKSIHEAFSALVKLNPTDKYKKQKAAGSLGGASNSKFLSRQGKTYTRTR